MTSPVTKYSLANLGAITLDLLLLDAGARGSEMHYATPQDVPQGSFWMKDDQDRERHVLVHLGGLAPDVETMALPVTMNGDQSLTNAQLITHHVITQLQETMQNHGSEICMDLDNVLKDEELKRICEHLARQLPRYLNTVLLEPGKGDYTISTAAHWRCTTQAPVVHVYSVAKDPLNRIEVRDILEDTLVNRARIVESLAHQADPNHRVGTAFYIRDTQGGLYQIQDNQAGGIFEAVDCKWAVAYFKRVLPGFFPDKFDYDTIFAAPAPVAN